MINKIETLAPFCRRAGIIISGRKKLEMMGKKLSFILVTQDLSENSLNDALNTYLNCPVVQWGTAEDIERLFGLTNTKILGFKTSTLSDQIFDELKDERL